VREDACSGDGGSAGEACGGLPPVLPLLGDTLCHVSHGCSPEHGNTEL